MALKEAGIEQRRNGKNGQQECDPLRSVAKDKLTRSSQCPDTPNQRSLRRQTTLITCVYRHLGAVQIDLVAQIKLDILH